MRMMQNRVVSAVSVAAVAGLAAPAAAQNERILDSSNGWAYLYGATGPDIAAQVSSGYRPFGIERVGSGQYDTVFVHNSGSHAVTGATVVYGQTATNLQNTITSGGYRILDLEAYDNGAGGTLFTAVLVPNSGSTSTPAWGWQHGVTYAALMSWMTSNPTLRLIDLDVYQINGVNQYSGVAVHNSGNNFQSNTWYMNNATASQISAALTTNGARLTQIEVVSPATLQNPTTFAAVMVSSNPGGGWWYPSLTTQQVADLHNQHGARLTALKRYTVLGQTRWAAAMVDNSNAHTRRMRAYFEDAIEGGTFGFKLKRVGGPVLAELNSHFVYEPASCLKILHAAYAIRRCSLGLDDLENDVYNTNRCNDEQNRNRCPEPPYYCQQGNEDLSETIRWMMQISHNGRTKTIEDRYTRATLNSFADNTLDLEGTQINHTLGCLDCSNYVHNATTASDMTQIYEKINDGSLFSGTWRDSLEELMFDLQEHGYDYYETLDALITQEAAATDLTATEISQFRAQVQLVNKGGGYGCTASGDRFRTDAGWANIPTKVQVGGNWFTLTSQYVFATFVHRGTDPGSLVAYSAKEEILREPIRAALATWDDACTAPTIFSDPSNQTAPLGGSVQFTSNVVGTLSSYDYQWQHQPAGGGSWTAVTNSAGHISGATTTTLTISNIVAADAGGYRLRVTSDCGSTWSDGAILTIGTTTCYANCDNSTASPVLNVADFTCFLQRFAAGNSYANCDNSTVQPVLNVADFTCFLQRFAAGCN